VTRPAFHELPMNGVMLNGSAGVGLAGPLAACGAHEDGAFSGLRSELGTEPLQAPEQSS
jgi:hypothetical protein